MTMDLNTEFIAFDIETTGLSPVFGRIVEIGAVKFRLDGTVLDTIDQLINPGCPIPAEVTAIHGIHDGMVRGKPAITEVLPKFIEFLGSSDRILMAHNAAFDVRFLSAAMSRMRLAAPRHAIIDSVQLSRHRLNGIRNHRLETIAQHFAITEITEHRATSDADVLKNIFLHLMNLRPRIDSQEGLLRIAATGGFSSEEFSPVQLPSGYELLEEAIKFGKSIQITYEGGTGGLKRREISPKTVERNRGNTYVIAICHIDGIEKCFRLDRIRDLA